MDLEMVLNELSINRPADDIRTAQQWMSDLIATARAASEAGVKRVLRTHIDINSTLLAEDYPLARWRNDSNVDVEIRRYFRVLVTQYPPLADLPEIENQILSQDFFHMDERAYGLGVAFLIEGLAVSFRSDRKWDYYKIDLNTQWLDDDGNLSSTTIQVPHANQAEHIVELTRWISDRLQTGVESGEDLWNRMNELFPSLIFCENVGKVIRYFQSGSPLLRQVVRRLFEIENYCNVWETGPFSPEGLPFKVTGESEPTLQKYEAERTFLCPDGEKRTFSWHGRVTPGAWRIYFDPSPGPGRMYIGYIGPKLPSVKFPT
ncbi:MAG: hypothetical protein JRJ42_08555 [Deltaproteobacteria bacterium]|nr:hypothetical protein [Deltaproteobacteria bacterium]MBW2020633.1 hypothetical protein [Deltaproteobacteria bacterium]